MILLLDIGNTHTHLGLANDRKVIRQCNMPTQDWFHREAQTPVRQFIGNVSLEGLAVASVVPRATPHVKRLARSHGHLKYLELTWETVRGVGIDYHNPSTIGADRLANAMAVSHHYGAPAIVIDFGTAVTFDVVDRQNNYVGGIIAPGLSAMTSYLHEKTALLPQIRIREVNRAIGKSTEEAMLIGAVHGYRGLIRELLVEVKRELHCRRLPVVATGGYAELIAAKLPEITAVDPLLTLEGLRLAFLLDNG
jgi:type III pantothenate kinase